MGHFWPSGSGSNLDPIRNTGSGSGLVGIQLKCWIRIRNQWIPGSATLTLAAIKLIKKTENCTCLKPTRNLRRRQLWSQCCWPWASPSRQTTSQLSSYSTRFIFSYISLWNCSVTPWVSTYRIYIFFVYFFGRASVGHFGEDWIRTQRAAKANRRTTNIATHLPT